MMNNFSFLLIVITLLAFSSCMQDHPNELDIKKEVQINAFITSSSTNIATRASDQTWANGDAIGVFMKIAGAELSKIALVENAKYIADDALLFKPATDDDKIYFPFNKAKVDFISYYPYQSNLSDLVYEVDVINQSNLADIDLLYSNNITSVSSVDESINLIFSHQLTKVVLDISTNNTGKDLTGLQAKITNVNTKASFSLVDGALTNANELSDIDFNVSGDGKIAEAILLPIESLTDEVLVITLGTISYSYPLTNSSSISSFDISTKYNFNITLQSGQGTILNEVSASITDWDSVSEDIIIVEDSAATPPEGEGPPVEPEPEPDPELEDGDGTKDNPYNIRQALQIKNKQKQIWVKGYIVGGYKFSTKESFQNNTTDGRIHTLALAISSNETEFENTFPIFMDNDLMNAFTLKRYPDSFQKEIYIQGYPDNWDRTPHWGLVGCTKAIIDVKMYN